MLRARSSANIERTHLSSIIMVLTLALVIASLYWAQAFLIPIAVSLLLTFLLTPLASALERIGLGRIPSVVLVAVFVFSILGAIGWIVALPVAQPLPISCRHTETTSGRKSSMYAVRQGWSTGEGTGDGEGSERGAQ